MQDGCRQALGKIAGEPPGEYVVSIKKQETFDRFIPLDASRYTEHKNRPTSNRWPLPSSNRPQLGIAHKQPSREGFLWIPWLRMGQGDSMGLCSKAGYVAALLLLALNLNAALCTEGFMAMLPNLSPFCCSQPTAPDARDAIFPIIAQALVAE
ncbi:uncharacterized protein VTP21DRAFT_7981 [Calcarisporiella thermophila]|uniref:uncharacterized protein n=1 Tax=Calcarisporiella thermophila TaxID=911321 RepID=UPI003743433C